ncbi:Gnk2-homologous domain [Macleaya cordata]|uniref:Gnk2-homologous domain n=1 Tax=Macleaya cordata TaxID=56857 RepID=A0A200QRQ1_MACCD|nr:Gnk2-homologous domain [Macleaya cordata]
MWLRQAIIWYDKCLFKYSNEKFFEMRDTENREQKKAHVSAVLFATGEMEMEGSEKLYGLVQCTRDLSSSECKKCLEDAVNEIPSCCDGKRGGRVVSFCQC